MNELKSDQKTNEKYFYKYRPINDHLIETLTCNELYFVDPRKYNDPIDSVVNGFIEGTFEEIIKYKVDNGQNRENAIWKLIDEICIGECQITGNKFKYNPPKKGLHFDFAHIPTYCLSERNDDILMWSHYADNHRGVCLSFKAKYGKIPDYGYEGYGLIIDNERIPINSIEYRNYMPNDINFIDKNNKENRLLEFLLTKGLCWEQEIENRMFSFSEPETNGIKICKFEKKELEGIIFGLNVERDKALDVYNVIKEYYKDIPIKFYKALKVKKEYKIKIKPICEAGIDEYIESLNE